MAWDWRDGCLVASGAGTPIELGELSVAMTCVVGGEQRRLGLELPVPAVSERRVRWTLANEGLELDLALEGSDDLVVSGDLHNLASSGATVETIALCAAHVRFGTSQCGLRFFGNGYQSWSETRSYAPDEAELLPRWSVMSLQQDNMRNLASGRRGHFCADMYGLLGDPVEGPVLLLGQVGGFRQFVYLRVTCSQVAANECSLELVWDFGGQLLASDAHVQLDPVSGLLDRSAHAVQDRYFEQFIEPRRSGSPQLESQESPAVAPSRARNQAAARPLPSGWCSWYYYYGKVSAADVVKNAQVAAIRGVDWQYMVLDDGYQRAVGDWLEPNARFPRGLPGVAEDIRSRNLMPGVWIAPFVVRSNARLFVEHRDWVLKDRNGKPVLAGWNPNWGLEGRFYALDTTHPGFQGELRRWIRTLVQECGFRYLKLDFVYAASLYGVAFDQSLSCAERLSQGYRIIREEAGNDTFVLGCGSPLAPAIGWVDAMRIGPDVAPYWFARYRYGWVHDPHALCTRFAIRSILTRSPMHRRLWINDPDCVMLRSTETRLTEAERMSLVNAVAVSGGMYLLSDRLSALSDETWALAERIQQVVQDTDCGRCWALDMLQQEMPELAYNSAGYLAAFNFADVPVLKVVPWTPPLSTVAPDGHEWEDVWTGEVLHFTAEGMDLGLMEAHSSRLLRIRR